MHSFLVALTLLAAIFWILNTLDVALGLPRLKHLSGVSPLEDVKCPTVSILFAARDEAEKLPDALETLLALDYPNYEVVAVNDRSEDGTHEILDGAARSEPRLKVVHISSLPGGWLGKPHALQQGHEHASGEWLVFTDADVHFSRDLLRRVVALAQREKWDHLTLLGRVEMHNPGERIALTFVAMAFLLGIRPWWVSNPQSPFYAGIGAFQLIRRSAYEAIGAHRRLAMEVVDDMKLGKLVKEAEFRSGVANSGDTVRVRWHAGVGNIVRGTTKNFFAASGFRLWVSCTQVLGLLWMFVLPLVALPFLNGWAFVFALIAVGMPVLTEGGVALEFGISPLYALTFPIGALILAWMLARSTIVTLWSGGITWRGTFYPLEELKRGVV
ncbi:MAG TPA: glycosyltransferase [Candidatus Limnocylindria bacterium]|nr:glycosyltransferase [Candidatus Limnocylindria bacterium]